MLCGSLYKTRQRWRATVTTNSGRTVARTELIDGLWGNSDDAPNERTIDVHVRRLRSKLGAYEDIVRTVRGVGYRFDQHADVSVRHATTPSPDF